MAAEGGRAHTHGGAGTCGRRLMAAAQDGYTALIWAARNGHADCARLLLHAGADKNAKNNVRARARWVGPVGCCGMTVLGDWCARRRSICISVLRFQVLILTFVRFGFCRLSAPNRRAAAKACGNEDCFSILRLGICASGDDSDEM